MDVVMLYDELEEIERMKVPLGRGFAKNRKKKP